MGTSSFEEGFVLKATAKTCSAVTALYSVIDFSKTGTHDIVVGREDGSLELYDLDENNLPVLLFSVNVSANCFCVCAWAGL